MYHSSDSGDATVSLNLNGNKLVLGEDGRWRVQSKDFQLALLEVEKLVNEKEQLSSSLLDAVTQIDYLKDEVVEINKMKTVVLEMVCRDCKFSFAPYITFSHYL